MDAVNHFRGARVKTVANEECRGQRGGRHSETYGHLLHGTRDGAGAAGQRFRDIGVNHSIHARVWLSAGLVILSLASIALHRHSTNRLSQTGLQLSPPEVAVSTTTIQKGDIGIYINALGIRAIRSFIMSLDCRFNTAKLASLLNALTKHLS